MSPSLRARLEEINAQLVAEGCAGIDMDGVEVRIYYSPGEPAKLDERLCTFPQLIAALHEADPAPLALKPIGAEVRP